LVHAHLSFLLPGLPAGHGVEKSLYIVEARESPYPVVFVIYLLNICLAEFPPRYILGLYKQGQITILFEINFCAVETLVTAIRNLVYNA